MRNTRPFSTSANSEHMSGQSCAQTTRTVSKSHSGEIAGALSQKPDGPSTSLLIGPGFRWDLSPGTPDKLPPLPVPPRQIPLLSGNALPERPHGRPARNQPQPQP